MTAHWLNLAYGHRLPALQQQQALCEGWRRLFGPGAGQ
ncbi:5'-nucleotidase/2',3'-cyclic phosphodiesterase and related esterases [Pseudomonas sp. FEN]|nr:5'-nucleotidase/2',3'-cyclic phosphodiesterase and related esterases [Pseudomonas sp. FEN]